MLRPAAINAHVLTSRPRGTRCRRRAARGREVGTPRRCATIAIATAISRTATAGWSARVRIPATTAMTTTTAAGGRWAAIAIRAATSRSKAVRCLRSAATISDAGATRSCPAIAPAATSSMRTAYCAAAATTTTAMTITATTMTPTGVCPAEAGGTRVRTGTSTATFSTRRAATPREAGARRRSISGIAAAMSSIRTADWCAWGPDRAAGISASRCTSTRIIQAVRGRSPATSRI